MQKQSRKLKINAGSHSCRKRLILTVQQPERPPEGHGASFAATPEASSCLCSRKAACHAPRTPGVWRSAPRKISCTVCAHIYMCIYIYIHTHIYRCRYTYTHTCVCISIYLPTYLPIYLSTYLPIYLLYVYIYVSIHLSLSLSLATRSGDDACALWSAGPLRHDNTSTKLNQ